VKENLKVYPELIKPALRANRLKKYSPRHEKGYILYEFGIMNAPARATEYEIGLMASITAPATPMPAVPGKSTALLAEKGVTGLSQTLNSPDGSVNRYDFFIAYATPDRPKARRLYWFLQDASCKVFLDVENLGPGALWTSALREALEASRAIVVLVSTQADDAFYQQEEIVRAIELARDKPGAHTVIPVTLEKLPQGAVSKPYGMSSLQALDATRSGGLERVAAELVAWLHDSQLDAK
jgi:hypothetical protein